MGGLDERRIMHELSNVLMSTDTSLTVSSRQALTQLQRPIRITMDSDALFHVKQLFWQGKRAVHPVPYQNALN